MYKKSSKRKDFNSKIQRNSPPPPSSSSVSTPQIPQSIQQSTQQSTPLMFDSIKQGFGFCISSSIEHKAVNSIYYIIFI